MGFTGIDYLILGLFLLGNLLLGTWLGRGQKSINDYFLAGKRIPMWAISLSIVATETSTLTFIGAPAIAYTGDLTFLQLAFGYIIGKILVSYLLIPAYFKGEIQTAYQLLQARFGQAVRNVSSILFLTTRGLSDGVRLFATGLVLAAITDMTDLTTMAIIGLITIVYTFFGGMRAVIWTDVVQLFIYGAGAILAVILLLDKTPGGWAEITAVAMPLDKFRVFDFSFDISRTFTFWAGIVGGAFLTFATHGSDQMMVQRYLASGSRRDSQVALVLSGVVVFFQFALFLLIGVMLFAFYRHFPPAQEIRQADQVFPLFIVNHMPTGLSGLVVAAVFAAAMSTLSSCLNSLSSATTNDFYRVYLVPKASDTHYLRMSRVFTLIWGAILVAVSMLARNWGSVLQAGLTIQSITMGSILGIFLLGMTSGRAKQKAALTGMITGLAAMLLVHYSGWFAWTWYTLIGTSVTVGVGLLVSRVGSAAKSEAAA
ncbi:MAG TPA: sodium:solute symporter [Acidobacteriota bacterium]|nr:sodium:solute symporter [Acidobacteriota bacterium]